MKHENTNTDANVKQQRPKLKVAFYCRVATAAQLEERQFDNNRPRILPRNICNFLNFVILRSLMLTMLFTVRRKSGIIY
jgi:hypothetical protein